MRDALLTMSGVTKRYVTGEVTVDALRGVDLTVYDGEFLVLLGPSGSGKSTLLNLLGGLDSPTEGVIRYDGGDLTRAGERALTHYRRAVVGFVFQFYNLIPSLTVRENVQLAADLSTDPFEVRALLDEVQLAERAGSFPSQLSGGQQQRVAIARAIVKNPRLLLCDEPTGALDVSTGVQVLQALVRLNKTYRKTVAVITHNTGVASIADRVIEMRDGRIISETVNETPLMPEQVSW